MQIPIKIPTGSVQEIEYFSESDRCVNDHVFVIHKIIKVLLAFITNFMSLPFATIYNSHTCRKYFIILSAKSNGKVRVTARKQIIQKLYEYFDKNQ
jgi:hypothetical protein